MAYVCFARENPALYRTMYDSACDQAAMPEHAKEADSGWRHVREALIDARADPNDEHELEMATIGAWCAAHGVAEMVGFREFEPLKAALGGEEAFVRAILDHVGIYAHRPNPPDAIELTSVRHPFRPSPTGYLHRATPSPP